MENYIYMEFIIYNNYIILMEKTKKIIKYIITSNNNYNFTLTYLFVIWQNGIYYFKVYIFYNIPYKH